VLALLPSGALGEAMRAAVDGGMAGGPLLVLLGWTVIGFALAARTFRWE
jgi:ABC-2 type transport system permease protein